METKYCYGCMKPRAQSPICPHCGWDARRENAAHQLPVGTVLQGKYLIGRALGQGGFGITYLGRDLQLNIPIAIKEYYPSGMVMRESTFSHSVCLVTESGDDRFAQNRARFLREAQTLARLEGVPHVVQVRNFFSENNTAYIIMGYVEGITLGEYLRRTGVPTPDALFRLLAPVMDVLEKVHALGLVHRDISPDNIMITPDAQVRIIDFGAAHEATGEDDKSTQAVLKHGYAPMEQYQSKGKLGPWTDVYAMCATIYRCLSTEHLPHATDRLMGDADFHWDSIPGLTAAQKAALEKGVALFPHQRLSSMGELRRLLLDPQSPPAAPAPNTAPIYPEKNPPVQEEPEYRTAPLPDGSPKTVAPERAKKPGRSPLPGILGAATLAALVILIVLLAWKPSRPRDTGISQPAAATQSTAATTVPALPPAGTSNILMEQPVAEIGSAGVLTAFRTAARRNQIRSVTVHSSLREVPDDAVDASQLGDRSVMAWVIPSGSLYDLHLAAEGGIIAPENCSGLFAGFSNLERADFGGAFFTPATTNMSSMFRDCPALRELDLSGMDTGNVTDVSHMFAGSDALTNVTVTFYPETVVSFESFMSRDGFCNGKPWKKLFLGDMVLMQNNVSSTNITVTSAFRTKAVRHSVASITFLPHTEDAPADAVDASLAGDGSVLAWVVPNGKLYDLYLAAEGGITAPADSSKMFEGFVRLKEIHFNGAFDTSQVVNMDSFFCNCYTLTALDLSCFETGNVTDMGAMFADCSGLTSLDVSSFDTSRVMDMHGMFINCKSLASVELSHFNTSQVTDMGSMFLGTNKLTNVEANFDTKAVNRAQGFMDSGDTVNGQPWRSLFPHLSFSVNFPDGYFD